MLGPLPYVNQDLLPKRGTFLSLHQSLTKKRPTAFTGQANEGNYPPEGPSSLETQVGAKLTKLAEQGLTFGFYLLLRRFIPWRVNAMSFRGESRFSVFFKFLGKTLTQSCLGTVEC